MVLDLLRGMAEQLLAPSEIVFEAATDILEQAGRVDMPPVLLSLLAKRALQSLSLSFGRFQSQNGLAVLILMVSVVSVCATEERSIYASPYPNIMCVFL